MKRATLVRIAGNLALASVSSAVALVAAEVVLERLNPRVARDRHRLLERVRELRRADPAVLPRLSSDDLTGMVAGATGTLALVGAAGTTTVLCDEAGPWVEYLSDRHGFRNPDRAWNRPVDVVLVGDSYVQGVCVEEAETFGGHFRGAGYETLNLGVLGAGPLHELAILREYAAPLRPPLVVWFYFDNDLDDLERERRRPLLTAYLDRAHSRGLRADQGRLDRAVREVADRELARSPFQVVLRRNLGFPALRRFVERKRCCDYSYLADVVARAEAEVAAWGGRLVVVALPSWDLFGGPEDSPLRRRHEERYSAALRALAQRGIRPLWPLPALASHPEPRTLNHAHYTAAGYAAIADAVLRGLAPFRRSARDELSQTN